MLYLFLYPLFFQLLSFVSSKISILQPQSLIDQLGPSIKFSVANFGIIPWGHRIQGTLDLSQQIDGCDAIKSAPNLASFLLVRRGKCSFVQKVLNAQKAGYQLVIIGDTYANELKGDFTMADDGFGFEVKIPSIFIGKNDADILQLATSQYDINTNLDLKIFLLIKFEIIKNKSVEILFAFDIESGESYKIMREFQPYYNKLKNSNINIKLLYQIYEKPQIQNILEEDQNCLCGQKYCAYDPDGEENIGTGQDILYEILRQLCMQNLNYNHFFQYLSNFRDNCPIPQAYDRCSKLQMKELSMNYFDINTCVSNSFIDPKTKKVTNNNQNSINIFLEDQINLNINSQITAYPSVLINGQIYQGRLTGYALFGEICNSFSNPPDSCIGEVEGFVGNSEKISVSQIINIIVIIFTVFLIFISISILFYKKIIKKDSEEQATQFVHEMIPQYFKFSEKQQI